MKNLITINEVDCYKGNAWKVNMYATHSAVQHQILVNDQPLGRRNRVSDDDRCERIIISKEVSQEFVDLFNQADKLVREMQSEYCNTMEEYHEAVSFNKPIREEIDVIILNMHAIESLDLSFEDFKRIFVWR